ncbi:MAG TPA: fatty acid--CoA ligase family protein [Gaiellales bacterium]|jgi:acyl-CoA synthetase (AMP-forming)/AMP-acid ligase II|nr:fatty acid--CoA ligase family protein [Gaiellales bacterium]
MPFAHVIERACVVDADGALDGHDLRRAASALALAFSAAGLGDGDVVGLALEPARALVPALAAAWEAGATVVLIPPGVGTAELVSVAQGLAPPMLVTSAGDAERVARATGGSAGMLAVDGLPPLALIVRAREPRPANLAGAALVKLSSGSSGAPKAIVLTHENVAAEAASVASALSLGPGDRVVAPVPLTHSYGFDLGVLAVLASGATLEQRPALSPRRGLADMAGATVYLGVPAIYRVVAEAPVSAPPSLGAVRYLLSCTAPLSPALIHRFATRFGAPICQHYGSSESGAVANHIPSRVLERPESVGRAIEGVGVEIAEDTGELVVHGPAVAAGYALGGPDGASPLAAGCFRTGDLAEIDAGGFIRIHGRRDSVINIGGLKVSPQEVAEALERHPAVREAAVVGVPDGRGDELVAAAVVLAHPVPAADLIAHCSGELAEHKVPRRIVVLDTLPAGPTGKLRLRAEDFAQNP